MKAISNNSSKKSSAKKPSKKLSLGQKMAIGGGVAAAAGVGAFYLFGPKAKTHQKKAKILINKIKKETAKKASQVKNLTEPVYHVTVDTLAAKYAKEYNIHQNDIQNLAKKLKGEWRKRTAKSAPRSKTNKKAKSKSR